MTGFTPTLVSRVCPNCQQNYPFNQAHVCSVGPIIAAATTDPLIGAILGERYQIESYLQGGGMGAVYRGRHTVLGKYVAIKILKGSKDEVAQQRFLLEAKSACTIGHANIIEINDYGILDDGRPYLVMEFLTGKALDEVIAEGPMAPLRVCRLGRQIALGLQAVHDKGIIHRDLKPGNIFVLDRDGEDFAKILDFGIAKIVAGQRQTLMGDGEPKGPQKLTQEGMVMGTAEYLSPEQATAAPLDARTDQYSFGCILYEMLTGEIPFQAQTISQIMIQHVTVPVTPPRKRRPELIISDELEAIVLQAMEKDPDKRFRSMRELALALGQEGDRLTAQRVSQSRPAIETRPEFPTPLPRERDTALQPLPEEATVAVPRQGADTLRKPAADTVPSLRLDGQRLKLPLVIGVAAATFLVVVVGMWRLVHPTEAKAPQPVEPPRTQGSQGSVTPTPGSGPSPSGSTSPGSVVTPPPPPPPKAQAPYLVLSNPMNVPVAFYCPGGLLMVPAGRKAQRADVPKGDCVAKALGFRAKTFRVGDLKALGKGKHLLPLKLDPL